MDRLRSMFGGGGEEQRSSGGPGYQETPMNDDESESLINDDTPATSATGGVFSKGAEQLMEKLETPPDYRIAGAFLVMSVLFFFASFTALPFILISPRSFNLYFCFSSIFLQLALAFFYSPVVYLRKLFTQENRIISSIYIGSLIIDLYFIWAGAGYLLTILLVGLQACSCAWFVTQAIGGGELANSWAYSMVLGSITKKAMEMINKGGNESSLPL